MRPNLSNKQNKQCQTPKGQLLERRLLHLLLAQILNNMLQFGKIVIAIVVPVVGANDTLVII